MAFLNVLILAAVVLWIYLMISQILLPISRGTRIFPAFRKDPLTEKVDATRDLVGTLKEQNANLDELQRLLKQRAELEKRIAEKEGPVVKTSQKE